MGKTNPKKAVLIAAAAVIVLIAAAIICKFTIFGATTKEKTNFSSFDLSVIKTELQIPTDRYTISEMKYTNSKETVFHIKVESKTIDILKDNYEYRGRSKDDTDYYKCNNNGDISCYVSKNDNIYNIDFTVENYNKDLFEIM